MPYVSDWVKPDLAFLVEGYPIYHVYKNDETDLSERVALSDWYKVFENEEDLWDPEAGHEFDVRDLPCYRQKHDGRLEKMRASRGREFHEAIVREALESGELADQLGIRIDFPPRERKFSGELKRTTTRTMKVIVKARSVAEAEEKALEKAGGLNFNQVSESDPEYEAEIQCESID